jgi:hypothetical protein
MERDMHAASSMALAYNGMGTHATARQGKHYVTCYEDE